MMQSNNMAGGKRSAVILLMTVSIIITVLGAVFGVYTFINNVTYKILSTDVPGFIFGAVIAFLGVRYCLSTIKLSKKLSQDHRPFSWANFKAKKI